MTAFVGEFCRGSYFVCFLQGNNDEREKQRSAPIGDAAGKLTSARVQSACFRPPSALSSVAIDRACDAGMEIC